MHETGDRTGDETADAELEERSAEHSAECLPDAAHPTAEPHLRTFRTGCDLPFLVLNDERRGDRSPPRDGDAAP